MATMYDIETNEFIEETAKELKNLIEMPEWAIFSKNSHGNERPPENEDWYFIRAASILRKIRMKGPIGTEKLRKLYTIKKNRGHKPSKVVIASGKITRSILQQLEKAEIIKQTEKGVHKGRIVTPKGMSIMDKIALTIYKKK